MRARVPARGCVHDFRTSGVPIAVPAAQWEPCHRAMNTTSTRSTVRPVRVVLVDDQAMFRHGARAVVACTPGFEVVGEAVDGESGLRLVAELDPELVIVDVRMPGMDGIEVVERLHAEDPERVLVLCSGGGLRGLAPVARLSGASALVNKHWLTPRTLRGLWIAHRRR